MARRDLVSLAIAALDEANHIRDLQKLVQITLEQLDNPPDDSLDRIGLILDSYRASMDFHLGELEDALEHLKKLVVGFEENIK